MGPDIMSPLLLRVRDDVGLDGHSMLRPGCTIRDMGHRSYAKLGVGSYS